MRALVIGARGFVGSHLVNEGLRRGHTVVGATRLGGDGLLSCDIVVPDQVASVIASVQPDVVLLPAANPNVDGCELEPTKSARINADGPANVAAACSEAGCRLVFFSSDYVFDGKHGPYRETDAPNPLQAYGRQKLLAERMIRDIMPHLALILRITVVFGWERQGKNFVARLISTLSRGEQLTVPNDQMGSPTLVDDLVAGTWDLVERNTFGLLHLAGSERSLRATFAIRVAQRFGLDARLVVPVETAALAQPAARPLNAGMDSTVAESVLGRKMLDIDAALERLWQSRS